MAAHSDERDGAVIFIPNEQPIWLDMTFPTGSHLAYKTVRLELSL